MNRSDNKKELEALIKTAEENRKELEKVWRKVEDLEAAIQSAKVAQDKSQLFKMKAKA